MDLPTSDEEFNKFNDIESRSIVAHGAPFHSPGKSWKASTWW